MDTEKKVQFVALTKEEIDAMPLPAHRLRLMQ